MDYFIAGSDMEADMAASANMTKEVYDKYNKIFTGMGSFKDHSLARSYQDMCSHTLTNYMCKQISCPYQLQKNFNLFSIMT